MAQEILSVVGTIAGIGGISLGILLLIYRDFLRDFIRLKVFKTLSSTQATLLIGATIIFTFSIAIISIYAGFVKDNGPTFFILLVVVLLLFILSALYIVVKRVNPGDERLSTPPAKRIYFEGYRLLEDGNFDDAERKFNKAKEYYGETVEFWYWKSRVAFARGNKTVASQFVDKALKVEPQHPHSLALKIKLLLLSNSYNDVDAKVLSEKSYGLSNQLDEWLNCLKSKDLFVRGPKTNLELDTDCTFPAYDWDTD